MKYLRICIFHILFWFSAASTRYSYFLPGRYSNYWRQKHFRVKQVPGDGACLFNALAVAVQYLHNGMHSDFDNKTAVLAAALRTCAVGRLSQRQTPLFLGGTEYVSSEDLLAMAAIELNTTVDEYIDLMSQPHTWGGGPEIVAISNILRRPIHLYTVHYSRLWPFRYYIKKSICFGEFTNTSACKPLRVLYTDGRFPHLTPWRDKLNADHFLALFEDEEQELRNNTAGRQSALSGMTFFRTSNRIVAAKAHWRRYRPWRALRGSLSTLLSRNTVHTASAESSTTPTVTSGDISSNSTSQSDIEIGCTDASDYILREFVSNHTSIHV